MLDQREITKLKENGWIDRPDKWPWKVIIYALLPEYESGQWMKAVDLHKLLVRFCEVIGRKPHSRYNLKKTLETMAMKGWIDMETRTERHETDHPDSPSKATGRRTKYVKRRDMDWWGNLVWPDWLPEMQVRGKCTPEKKEEES
jgi:hypothetical protein